MANILVVEDDFNTRLLIAMILKMAGHEVSNAENGRQALESLLGSCHFDLIISDILMAEMNGLEFLGWAKQICPSTPVMILSVHSRPDMVKDALQKGAACYQLKPITKGQLITIVEDLLGSGHSLKDNEEQTGYRQDFRGQPVAVSSRT
jgi:two-component system, chemotaxis family, chemotaxis protein CheY